jgi:2-C-methyl-D-erythritol 4-phosphate cytidylyltransferase
MNKYAIIVAGGTGTRMQGEVPKQFLLLNGKPVIMHSVEAFRVYDPLIEIILVIHPDYMVYWNKLCLEFNISVPFVLAKGGKTRFESVNNGLQLINEDGLVAIHDAARPVIHAGFVSNLFSAAATYGSAIPAVPLNDTIRVVDGDTSHQADRTFLRAIQTPQVFKVSEIKRAYTQPYQHTFTDDGSVMDAAGFQVNLAEGFQENIKITHMQDIAVAEVLIKNLPAEGL